jgi:hypothetical protein
VSESWARNQPEYSMKIPEPPVARSKIVIQPDN